MRTGRDQVTLHHGKEVWLTAYDDRDPGAMLELAGGWSGGVFARVWLTPDELDLVADLLRAYADQARETAS